jgi:hypothetical protein
MHRFRPKQNRQSTPEYATCSDLCESLLDDLRSLYLLAFLLTGTHSEAEQCFVATVGDVLSAKCVFKGWESSWSRRCLIINAIHFVFALSANTGGKADSWCGMNLGSGECSAFDALTKLSPPIQRFVFVMSVLERYSGHECSLLLGRAPRDVFEARSQALRKLSGLTPTPAFAKIARTNVA